MFMMKCYRLMLAMMTLLMVTVVEANPSWVMKTQAGKFSVTIFPENNDYYIGDYHNWIIKLTDHKGNFVPKAHINFSGGMVGHGHGLPSQPVISELGEGKYLLEGMLFSMAGEWTLIFGVQTLEVRDKARFDITLAF